MKHFENFSKFKGKFLWLQNRAHVKQLFDTENICTDLSPVVLTLAFRAFDISHKTCHDYTTDPFTKHKNLVDNVRFSKFEVREIWALRGSEGITNQFGLTEL